ncbi:hypothetical protein ABGC46_003286 [Escherichia coli]
MDYDDSGINNKQGDMMTFIKITRQREFMERSNSARLVLRKEKKREETVL